MFSMTRIFLFLIRLNQPWNMAPCGTPSCEGCNDDNWRIKLLPAPSFGWFLTKGELNKNIQTRGIFMTSFCPTSFRDPFWYLELPTIRLWMVWSEAFHLFGFFFGRKEIEWRKSLNKYFWIHLSPFWNWKVSRWLLEVRSGGRRSSG